MNEKSARNLTILGIVYYCVAAVEWLVMLILFLVGHTTALALAAPLLFAGAGYAVRSCGLRRLRQLQVETAKPEPQQIESGTCEPFTRTPGANQCPVCGLDDLENWRLYDRHLTLVGDERYVQKWGDHDAHWSCVQTCPYVPTQAELHKKAHDGGQHPQSVAGCSQCVKRTRRKEIEREDWEVQGCTCRKCIGRIYDRYRFSGGLYTYHYDLLEEHVTTGPRAEYTHYSLMASTSDDPDVKAYAYEKLIELEERA